MIPQMILAGSAATTILFFLLIYAVERKAGLAWAIAWRVGLNIATACVAGWALSGSFGAFLARADDAVAIPIFVAFVAAVIAAGWAPWFFRTPG